MSSVIKRHLAPLDTVPACECRQQQPHQATVQCPTCQKSFLTTSLVISDVERDVVMLGSYTCIIKMYCDHCNVLLMRQFYCSNDGSRIDAPVGDVRRIFDRGAIEMFLRQHPQAAGVEQS